MSGSYKVIRLPGNRFTWQLMSRNHRVLLRGSSYPSREAAREAIARCRRNSACDGRYRPDRADSGEPCFLLLDEGDRILGRSALYLSDSARNRGIDAVRNNAPTENEIDATRE